MAVYPNPTSDEANVELLTIENGIELIPAIQDRSTGIKIKELKLYDSNSNLLRSYLLLDDDGSKSSIKFDKELKGIYYIKAFFSDGSTDTKRIQINK